MEMEMKMYKFTVTYNDGMDSSTCVADFAFIDKDVLKFYRIDKDADEVLVSAFRDWIAFNCIEETNLPVSKAEEE